MVLQDTFSSKQLLLLLSQNTTKCIVVSGVSSEIWGYSNVNPVRCR